MEGHTPEVPLRPGPTFRNTETLTHLVLWTAVFFVFAFYRTLPSLQQKLLGALLTPVGCHDASIDAGLLGLKAKPVAHLRCAVWW